MVQHIILRLLPGKLHTTITQKIYLILGKNGPAYYPQTSSWKVTYYPHKNSHYNKDKVNGLPF